MELSCRWRRQRHLARLTLQPRFRTGTCWTAWKQTLLAQLDPDTQAVYRLRLYRKPTFPAIAAILGQPEAAVTTRYYRLMARLRKEFGSYGTLE